MKTLVFFLASLLFVVACSSTPPPRAAGGAKGKAPRKAAPKAEGSTPSEAAEDTRPTEGAQADNPSKAETPKAAAIDPDATGVSEVLGTEGFVELAYIDPFTEGDVVRWDHSSAKFLYVTEKEPPFIYLTGTIEPGFELSVDDRWAFIRGERFQIKVTLPLQPKVFRLKVFSPDRSCRIFRIINYWSKFPPEILGRVRQGGRDNEQALGFKTKFRRAALIQLYSQDVPANIIDIDSQKHALLTLRTFYPPVPEDSYDGWRLVVRDSRNRVVGELSRFGLPPAYLDWRDIGAKVYFPGTYSYQLNLYKDEQIYEGAVNRFEVIEGKGVLNRPYLSSFQFEPKQEVGHFAYRNKLGEEFSGLYVGGELPFIFWSRFLVRATALVSLHGIDPDQNFTFTRVGMGYRLFGHGDNAVLGRPHSYRLDILLNHTGYTFSPASPIKRFSHFSLMVEPHLILGGQHYIVPWVEYGSKVEFEQQRFSFGLNYVFFIRPWSVKLGMGFAYDDMFVFTEAPPTKFTLFRTLTSFTFAL